MISCIYIFLFQNLSALRKTRRATPSTKKSSPDRETTKVRKNLFGPEQAEEVATRDDSEDGRETDVTNDKLQSQSEDDLPVQEPPISNKQVVSAEVHI